MLDCALDNMFMTRMTAADKGAIDRDGLVEMLFSNVEHMALSYGRDWWQCKDLLQKLKDMPRWDVQWGRQAKAVMERVSLALQAQADDIYSMVQPKAEEFGAALRGALDKHPHAEKNQAYITNFGEEVIRGSGGLVVAQILQALSGHVRAAGQLGVWEVASSQDSVNGELKVMDDIVGIQGQSFDTPQVLLVNKLGGMEDIPPGVVAILSPMGVDVLSHIAIRARNQKVLLASCHDDGVFSALVAANKDHKFAKVSLDANLQVVVQQGESASALAPTAAAGAVKLASADLEPSKDRYVMLDNEFRAGCLGGKSNNLQLLRTSQAEVVLPGYVKLPSSVALPFGVFDRVLADPVNSAVATKLTALETQLCGDATKDEVTLQTMRDTIVAELAPPSGLIMELRAACSRVGFAADLMEDEEACFDAIKQVWASKWSARATFSRNACQIPHGALHMAVLCQQVVAGDYAFVLHTTNPVTKNTDEVLGEVCVGLGEALVGNYPGRALSFTYNKKTKEVALNGFASKRLGVFLTEDSLIFRSDSNGEDLEGFAGAGLYDSVIASEPLTTTVDYTNDPMTWDGGLRDGVLKKLGEVAMAIELATGSAQDVEGVVQGESVTVVQLRPQVQ